MTLLEDVTLVAKTPAYESVAPKPQSFNVTDAGKYRITASDVGFPNALMWTDIIVTKGASVVAHLTQFGAKEFDAAVGTYVVHVLGGGAGPGTIGVTVESATANTKIAEFQAGIVSSPISGAAARSTIAKKVTITSSGSYQITLTDRRFPVALSTFDLILLNEQGVPLARMCQPAVSGVCDGNPVTVTATPGAYDLFVNALAAQPLQAGLLSIKVNAGTNVVYSATHTVGVLESHAFFDLPSNGQYTLTLNDLQFPAALDRAQAMLTQGADLLVSVDGANAQSFTAQQGTATLYTIATPSTTTGIGSLGISIPFGSQLIYSDSQAVVSSTTTGARAYAFVGNFPSSGMYRIRGRDFGFPASIPTLQFLVTQDGAPLGAFNVGGSLTVQAHSGSFMVVAVANVLSSTATGLFNVTVDAVTGGAIVLDRTQGVGDLFNTRSLFIDHSGRFDVQLSDLGYPANFDDLALLVTRGDTMVGQIFGGGTFSFDATPGTYSLNFVARNQGTANYGMYGLVVGDSPPAPTLAFTAKSLSVAPQGSANVTWSTTGADSCAASGGWTGTKPANGTDVIVGPIASDTTLTLTCSGAGGTRSSQLKIVVDNTETKNDSGGGAFDFNILAAALSLALATRARNRKR